MKNGMVLLLIALIFQMAGCASSQTSQVAPPSLVEVAQSDRQWTGIAVARDGRIFVNYPRWSENVPFSVGELKPDGSVAPYPDITLNTWEPGSDPAERFVCVQSVVIDRDGYLWILDPDNPRFKGVVTGGPKLMKVDLASNRIIQTIRFAAPVIEPGSYLNDVRIDTRRQVAYITDSGAGAIVVVDLVTLELALNVLAGMPELSLNLVSSMAGSAPLEPEGTTYASFLREIRPYLNELARCRSGKIRMGIGVSDHPDSARHSNLHGESLMGWIQARPWESLLARLGFPIGHAESAPHWLAGDVIRALSDYELAWYLREGVVLDPLAAQILMERRWAEDLGLQDVCKVGTAVNEVLTSDSLVGKRGGEMLPVYNHVPFEQLYRYEFANPTGRILSRWLDVDGVDRGPATILLSAQDQLFSASLPWKACLLPFALTAPATALLNIARRELWADALVEVSGHPLPGRVTKGVNVYPMIFQAPPQSREMLVVAINLSADDVSQAEILLKLERKTHWRSARFGADGQWVKNETLNGASLKVDIDAFSLAAYRLLPETV